MENKVIESEPGTAKTLQHPKSQLSQGTKCSLGFLASVPLSLATSSSLQFALQLDSQSLEVQLPTRCGKRLQCSFYLVKVWRSGLWRQLG